MSDPIKQSTVDANEGGKPGASANGGAPAFAPITTQEAFDHAIGERLGRAEAKHKEELAKFADYEALKAKAAKVDAAEEAKKTESQKVADQLAAMQKRIDDSEKRAAEAEQARLRASVASTKGVPESILPASGTREELEKAADELKAWAKGNGAGGLGPGASPTGGSGEGAPKSGGLAAGRELFEAGRKKASTN